MGHVIAGRLGVADAASPAEHREFTRYAWAVLGYNVFVVGGGALVRASGSGAGCGAHWPLCQGELTPTLKTVAMMIEFFHRCTSGIDTLLVAGLVWWAWRAFPRGHAVRQAAAYSGLFLVIEALLGAALAVFGWVGSNASPARAIMLSVHQANTLTLIAAITLTAWWSVHARAWPGGVAAWRAWSSVGAVVVLAITGALAALADTLYPSKTFMEGAARDFGAQSNLYLQLRSIHPVLAIGVGLWLVYFATFSAARNQRALRLAFALAGLVGLQLLAGALNMLLAAPVWLQLLHLFLADAVWVSLVVFCANLGESNRGR